MHNFLGHDGFVWWIGQVVSIDDPITLGRCRVRIFGYHGEERDIPDDDLPWAVAIHPINTPNFYGTPREGDFVFGFFLDALAAQEPAMLGYFPYAPPGQTKSFSTITQKDSIVFDVNGAKIAISNTGVVRIESSNNIIISSNSDVIISGSNVSITSISNTHVSSSVNTMILGETVNINSTISTTIQNLDVDGLIISPSANT